MTRSFLRCRRSMGTVQVVQGMCFQKGTITSSVDSFARNWQYVPCPKMEWIVHRPCPNAFQLNSLTGTPIPHTKNPQSHGFWQGLSTQIRQRIECFEVVVYWNHVWLCRAIVQGIPIVNHSMFFWRWSWKCHLSQHWCSKLPCIRPLRSYVVHHKKSPRIGLKHAVPLIWTLGLKPPIAWR